MCDPFTRLVVQYAIFLLIFGLAFVSTTLPLSLTNVILLGFMTVLVIRYFVFSTQVQLYKNSSTILWFLNVVTLIAIVTRYIAQFKEIATAKEDEGDDTETFLALMLGYKRDGFAIRLLSLTVILVISNMQLTILKN